MSDKRIQSILNGMPLNKIEKLAKDDNPDALFELAQRNKKSGDDKSAENNLILAAQLGHSDAAIELSEMYIKDGNTSSAEECLKKALHSGDESAYFKLATLIKPANPDRAIYLLTTGAALNQKDCIEELITHYEQAGNEYEAEYYRRML